MLDCSLFRFVLMGLWLAIPAVGSDQAPKATQTYPSHLPYRFANFVWWSDEELRALLKKRIPGLGDEIATTTAAEGKVRDALTALLKEKGIAAEVQSQEPSNSAIAPLNPMFFGRHLPEQPLPAIEFSILAPKVQIDKVRVRSDSDEAVEILQTESKSFEGKPYSASGEQFTSFRLGEVLGQKGYLSAQVHLSHEAPRKENERFLVDLSILIDSGPKYHVSSITADGGPLLPGRDLSQFIAMKKGDVAGAEALWNLEPKLRAYYQQSGYADVDFEDQPTLDRDHGLAAYHLVVIPGPVYHLRSLTVHNLNPELESKIRELFGMKPGDVYREEAVNDLYQKIAGEPILKGYGFSFGPKRDRTADAVDLSLEFYKEGGESSVTIK
jgi:outer membrane translocation and assembly module TamA